MLTVYLLRHGETAWNADGNRYCGRTDLPLTAIGIQQAKVVSDQLKRIHFDAVFSSPLQRALQTAQIASGGKDVVTDSRLTEIDFGKWEGKTKEEFIAENKNLWVNWLNDPAASPAGGTGENAKSVIERVSEFYIDLLKRYPSGKVLVVGHNGINRLYLSYKLGMPLRNYRKFFLDNAAITLFTLCEKDGFQLKCLNGSIKIL